MALIVSVSGIRGLTDSELTTEIAQRYAIAFGQVIGGGKVLVGRDSRPSGEELVKAVVAGLNSVGCEVIDVGILPTPTCGFLVRELETRGGIMVTASHNPAPYNGLKLFGPDGAVLSAAKGKEIQQKFVTLQVERGGGSNGAASANASSEVALHLRRVLELIDVDAIRAERFRVVVDGNGGAGGPLAISLLTQLGCRILANNCEPDGNFRHDPEPTPDHLQEVAQLVKATNGAIGFALDPDSDRLALIDETGRCLSEEITLALAVRERLAQERGPIVINLSTSRMSEDVARTSKVPCYRSAVGEANVVGRMREVNALIGGEGNGGVIDPRVGWVRDPFIGIGLILSHMVRTNRSLARLASELPQYTIHKAKFTVPTDRLPELFDRLIQGCRDVAVDRTDGIRLAWDDRWLHVRASNTEPIIRVIAEAPTAAVAQEMTQFVGTLLV